MPRGFKLERRRTGVYYFRQTTTIEGKQVAKRISLGTKEPAIAKMLSIQLMSEFQMSDPKFKKLEVQYGPDDNITYLKIDNEDDERRFATSHALIEQAREAAHRRKMELLEAQRLANAQEKQSAEFLALDSTKEKADLYHRLTSHKTLWDLKKEYMSTLKVGAQTVYKYNRILDHFINFCIDHHRVNAIEKVTRALVYQYLNYLKEEGKADKTIQNIFNPLATFFNHLIIIGETKDANPFNGHKLEYVKEPRQPFTFPELKQIFTHEKVISKPQTAYILLLLLTTGCRPNEICQLHDGDIFEHEGTWVIRITADEEKGQTVKTKKSKRLLPLHPLLVNAGFIAHVKTRSGKMIFDLTKPKLKNYSTFFSEDFTRLLREDLNIKNAGKVLYSFRHTVITRFKHKFIEKSVSQDFIGHDIFNDDKSRPQTIEGYEQSHTPEVLQQLTGEVLFFHEVPELASIKF